MAQELSEEDLTLAKKKALRDYPADVVRLMADIYTECEDHGKPGGAVLNESALRRWLAAGGKVVYEPWDKQKEFPKVVIPRWAKTKARRDYEDRMSRMEQDRSAGVCPECHGKKKVVCPECDGSGKYSEED